MLKKKKLIDFFKNIDVCENEKRLSGRMTANEITKTMLQIIFD